MNIRLPEFVRIKGRYFLIGSIFIFLIWNVIRKQDVSPDESTYKRKIALDDDGDEEEDRRYQLSKRIKSKTTATTMTTATTTRPHILFILADDYGWKDIGYHGSDIQTPYLDQLASEGVKLEQYYALATCSPSRASILTGRYSSQTTINRMMDVRDNCPPSNLVMIPEILRTHGYATHLVGKWHVGMRTKECLPNQRGFDSFLGFLEANQDYYTHEALGRKELDFFENDIPRDDFRGEYSTHLFAQRAVAVIKAHSRNPGVPMFLFLSLQSVHTPLQVPRQYLDIYDQPRYKDMDDKRKILAGMTTCMDEAVYNVTEGLRRYGLWNNSVVVFSSDNGGASSAKCDNGPLRGFKSSYFEGGIRVNAFLNSPLLTPHVRGAQFNGLMGIADWFPTLVEGVANIPMKDIPTDGFNMWNALRYGFDSPRKEYLYAVGGNCNWTMESPPEERWMYGAIRIRNYKLLIGPEWQVERLIPPRLTFYEDNSHNAKHLYDVLADPSETNNLFEQRPSVVKLLMQRLRYHCLQSVMPVTVPDSSCQENVNSNRCDKMCHVCKQSDWLRHVWGVV